MNYLDEVERDFREVISKGDVEALVKWVKERVLLSYRNGQRSRSKFGKGAPRQTRTAETS